MEERHARRLVARFRFTSSLRAQEICERFEDGDVRPRRRLPFARPSQVNDGQDAILSINGKENIVAVSAARNGSAGSAKFTRPGRNFSGKFSLQCVASFFRNGEPGFWQIE